ncbi:MAG: NIPSNAP family protein [Tannerellaceae bacterium]|nr:NIPSNAP family protein [Tannerellaceae bacterium]
MRRRNFLKTGVALAALPTVNSLAAKQRMAGKSKEFYEWKIYTLTDNGDLLDTFYRDVLIPAYNRQGVKVGAFRPYKKEDENKKRYYIFVYSSWEVLRDVQDKLWEDTVFVEQSRSFYGQTAPQPVYSEFDTYICEAFDRIPQLIMPDKSRTLFEFRFYHSPNEEANRRKVRMFNVEEIDLFDKVGINPVCYGDIKAGPNMPALIYLTWYVDEDTRHKVWGEFSKHPDWHAMRDRPEYAHTATNNTSTFLSPMEYSQV